MTDKTIYFLASDPGGGHYQGHVVAWKGKRLRGQLYSWIHQLPTKVVEFVVKDHEWMFFDNPEDWNTAGRKSCRDVEDRINQRNMT